MFKTVSAVLCAALLSMPAHAAFVEYDWKNTGDKLVSFDTETRLLWLDLTVTKNTSINEMKALLVNDARFEGYRLPTLEEVHTLASSIFTRMSQVGQSGSISSGAVPISERDVHARVGQNTPGYTYGLYSKDGVGSQLFGSGPNGLFYNYTWATHLNFKRSYEGVYLVADRVTLSSTVNASTITDTYNLEGSTPVTDVTAPGMLAALGLLGLFAGRRRRLAHNKKA